MIRIVNWLLTRKCNLKCDYCAIVKDYPNMPRSYPLMSHYYTNEMSTEVVINALAAFKKHNPLIFHVFYGGEPLLRPDLPDIINYCNENKIYYTIISNNTPEIQPLIDKLFKETDCIAGFSSSVDPIIEHAGYARIDRITKSIEGLKRLKEMQASGKVKDVVAEITVMNSTRHLLYDLLSELSKHEIYSSITFIDIAKNNFYDFSNIHDESYLVKPSWSLSQTFARIMEDNNLYVHMKDVLIPKLFDTLPSNFDCKLEESVHNVTVDADGSMRLCLRIKGILSPAIHVSELFELDGSVSKDFHDIIRIDKRRFCRLCNHSCMMMSQYINDYEEGQNELIHTDKRG